MENEIKSINNLTNFCNIYYNRKNTKINDNYYLFENAKKLFEAYSKASQLNYKRNQIDTKDKEKFRTTQNKLDKAIKTILKEFYI